MAGMDANLSLEQARKQQTRTSSDNETHQGPKKSGSAKCDNICEKVAHQGK